MALVNTSASSAAMKAMEKKIKEDHIADPSGTMYQSIQEQITKTNEEAQIQGIRRPVLSA